MGTTRNRSRGATTVPSGPACGEFRRYWVSSGVQMDHGYGFGYNNWSESCQDVVDNKPYPDHALVLTKRYRDTARWSGKVTDVAGLTYYVYSGYVSPLRNSPTHAIPSVNSGYWITKALANANPNRPDVDLPVFIFELKDLPRMIRGLGDVLRRRYKASDVAGGYLAYSFGWRPLFSDLSSLLDFADSIARRKALLEGMRRGRRIKRNLGTNTSPAASETGTVGGCKVTLHYQWTERVWYTARIKADLSAFPTSDQLQSAAMRAALGLNLSASQIWEIIPWSWFIDYMANVGDVLAANRNFIPWKLSKLCVMIRQEMDVTSRSEEHTIATSQVACSGGHGHITAKRRFVAAHPSPTFAWQPFITGHQTAILGSLLTASALRAVKK